jgi:creatinine amidohydrolase/Fe(II)-dependent formamide hydrolase-like protein
LLTTNTGCGYPFEATPEKGEQLLATLSERLATALVELSAAPLDERFPY